MQDKKQYTIEDVEPLDMIFFTRPSHDLVTAAIQSASKFRFGKTPYQWSHVGIVVNKQVMTTLKPASRLNMRDDQLYLWESTLSSGSGFFTPVENIPDVETRRYRFGVQIRPLNALLDAAKQAGIGVGLSKMSPATRQSLPADYINSIDMLHTQFKLAKYETNICKLSCAFCQKCRSKTTAKRVFSSQFATHVYKNIGVFNDKIYAAGMLPIELAYPHVSDDNYYAENFPDTFAEPEILIEPGVDNSLSGQCTRLMTTAVKVAIKIAIKLLLKEADKALKHSKYTKEFI